MNIETKCFLSSPGSPEGCISCNIKINTTACRTNEQSSAVITCKLTNPISEITLNSKTITLTLALKSE